MKINCELIKKVNNDDQIYKNGIIITPKKKIAPLKQHHERSLHIIDVADVLYKEKFEVIIIGTGIEKTSGFQRPLEISPNLMTKS